MEVLTRVRCDICDGRGIAHSPMWRECCLSLNPERKDWIDAALAWWADRGYRKDQIPPEEQSCDECEGSGWLQRWLKLEEFRARFNEETQAVH